LKEPELVIPFKGQALKSRLSPVLGARERREVAYLLLEETLRAVKEAGMARRCHVVSSDSKARLLVERFGALFIPESEPTGVNDAVRLAMRTLKGKSRFLVIPSDLPLLSPEDLREAEELGRAKSVVIGPSASFDGTNLLLFSRDRVPPLAYDDNSFWNHLGGAAKMGLTTAVLARRGVLHDLDTASDTEELTRLGVNTRVTRFLRKSLRK